MWGGWDFVWAFVSMMRDLMRGRLPRQPHGFALFLVIALALGAALMLTYLSRIEAWLTDSIDRRLPH